MTDEKHEKKKKSANGFEIILLGLNENFEPEIAMPVSGPESRSGYAFIGFRGGGGGNKRSFGVGIEGAING